MRTLKNISMWLAVILGGITVMGVVLWCSGTNIFRTLSFR